MDIDADFEDDYFAAKYGKLHYRHHTGEGSPIVFLHGFAGSISSWKRLVARLPDSLDIYLIDLMGHGLSDAPQIEYSVLMQYGALSEFIRNNLDNEPVLFGHSYGGWIAAYYAAHKRISDLVLESPSGLRQFMEERQVMKPEYREHMINSALQMNHREHVLRSTLYVDNESVMLDPEILSSIRCRCLIIWGLHDGLISQSYADEFHRLIKGSQLRKIDHAKHTVHYTNPEVIAELLVGFLDG